MTLYERFEAKYVRGPQDECWPWTGAVSRRYGHIRIDGKSVPAHRVAYEFAKWRIPNGLCVLHKCDNPPCVNPAHLVLGTLADNSADMVAKGRSARGEKQGRSKLIEQEVVDIRRAYALGGTTHREIAEVYGVCPSLVGLIVNHRIWAHVGAASG